MPKTLKGKFVEVTGSNPVPPTKIYLSFFVGNKQAKSFACVRNQTAESYFFSRKNRRAGAQTFSSDGEKKVEGDTPVSSTKMYLVFLLFMVYISI